MIFSSCTTYSKQKEINFTGTDWCPYTCVDKNKPGFITEYAQHLFKKIGMKFNVTLLPWNRAMIKAKRGDYDGLITASKLEAKGLLKAEQKTLDYQMCFYVLPTSTWTYKGINSLKNIILGGAQGYSYGEPIDSYIIKKMGKISLLAGNITIHKRLKQMLELKRIDALISDRYVLNFHVGNTLKLAGCLKAYPMYFAFNKKVSPRVIQKFNAELKKPENTQYLKQLISSYAS